MWKWLVLHPRVLLLPDSLEKLFPRNLSVVRGRFSVACRKDHLSQSSLIFQHPRCHRVLACRQIYLQLFASQVIRECSLLGSSWQYVRTWIERLWRLHSHRRSHPVSTTHHRDHTSNNSLHRSSYLRTFTFAHRIQAQPLVCYHKYQPTRQLGW